MMWPFSKSETPKLPDCVVEYNVVKTVKLRLTKEQFDALCDLSGCGTHKIEMAIKEFDEQGRTITFYRKK